MTISKIVSFLNSKGVGKRGKSYSLSFPPIHFLVCLCLVGCVCYL